MTYIVRVILLNLCAVREPFDLCQVRREYMRGNNVGDVRCPMAGVNGRKAHLN